MRRLVPPYGTSRSRCAGPQPCSHTGPRGGGAAELRASAHDGSGRSVASTYDVQPVLLNGAAPACVVSAAPACEYRVAAAVELQRRRYVECIGPRRDGQHLVVGAVEGVAAERGEAAVDGQREHERAAVHRHGAGRVPAPVSEQAERWSAKHHQSLKIVQRRRSPYQCSSRTAGFSCRVTLVTPAARPIFSMVPFRGVGWAAPFISSCTSENKAETDTAAPWPLLPSQGCAGTAAQRVVP